MPGLSFLDIVHRAVPSGGNPCWSPHLSELLKCLIQFFHKAEELMQKQSRTTSHALCRRFYCQAQASAQLAQQQCDGQSAQLLVVMAALDSCQAEWQAAEAGRQALLRALGDKAQAASRHAVERMAAQVGLSSRWLAFCLVGTMFIVYGRE